MGRYDRNSERYSRLKSNNSNGVPLLIVLFLILAGGLAGFFARPYIDDMAQPINGLLALATEEGQMAGVATKPQPPAPAFSEPATETEQLETVETPPAPIILPELDSSDNEFRKAVTTAAPELAPWLATDNLIRKFMVLANDFSQNIRINKHVDFMKLPQAFTVKESGGGLFIAPESHQRYNTLALAIDHLDATAMVNVYQVFKPLLLQVFSEFSYPENETIEKMLGNAAAGILSAPIIEGDIPVLKHSVYYRFADPQLEAMNPVHKQMLRMGSENTRIIQNKVRLLLEKINTAN